MPASRKARRTPGRRLVAEAPPARRRGGAHSCLAAGCQERRPSSPPLTGAGTLAGLGTRRAGGRPHPQNPTQTRSCTVSRECGGGRRGLSPARLQEPPHPGAGSLGQGGRRRPCSLSGGGSSREVDLACSVKHLLRQGPPGQSQEGRRRVQGGHVTATCLAFAGTCSLPCFLGVSVGGRWPFLRTLGPPLEASGLSSGQSDASRPGGDPGGSQAAGEGPQCRPWAGPHTRCGQDRLPPPGCFGPVCYQQREQKAPLSSAALGTHDRPFAEPRVGGRCARRRGRPWPRRGPRRGAPSAGQRTVPRRGAADAKAQGRSLPGPAGSTQRGGGPGGGASEPLFCPSFAPSGGWGFRGLCSEPRRPLMPQTMAGGQ